MYLKKGYGVRLLSPLSVFSSSNTEVLVYLMYCKLLAVVNNTQCHCYSRNWQYYDHHVSCSTSYGHYYNAMFYFIVVVYCCILYADSCWSNSASLLQPVSQLEGTDCSAALTRTNAHTYTVLFVDYGHPPHFFPSKQQ